MASAEPNVEGAVKVLVDILTANGFTKTRAPYENNFREYIEFSPGILFVVLPAIASRPCFERDLSKAGAIGIFITLILIFLCGYNFL